MCKEWRNNKSNHHFPELNKKGKSVRIVKSLFSWSKITVLLVTLICVIGLTYLIQTNMAATQGFKMKELNQKVNELREQNKKLNLEYIELQSVANITEEVSNLNLVATDNLEIITPLGSSMALK